LFIDISWTPTVGDIKKLNWFKLVVGRLKRFSGRHFVQKSGEGVLKRRQMGQIGGANSIKMTFTVKTYFKLFDSSRKCIEDQHLHDDCLDYCENSKFRFRFCRKFDQGNRTLVNTEERQMEISSIKYKMQFLVK